MSSTNRSILYKNYRSKCEELNISMLKKWNSKGCTSAWMLNEIEKISNVPLNIGDLEQKIKNTEQELNNLKNQRMDIINNNESSPEWWFNNEWAAYNNLPDKKTMECRAVQHDILNKLQKNIANLWEQNNYSGEVGGDFLYSSSLSECRQEKKAYKIIYDILDKVRSDLPEAYCTCENRELCTSKCVENCICGCNYVSDWVRPKITVVYPDEPKLPDGVLSIGDLKFLDQSTKNKEISLNFEKKYNKYVYEVNKIDMITL